MFKSLFPIFFLALCASCGTAVQQEIVTIEPFWTPNKAAQHMENRDDSSSWDWDLFESDLSFVQQVKDYPFPAGVYPVPKYDLIGEKSFTGVGVYGYTGDDAGRFELGGKTVLFNSFYANKSPVNSGFIDSLSNEVFFHIVFLTDYVDTFSYAHLGSHISSRNHPDYVGQGFFKTLKSQIDYQAFLTADRNNYALVNLRLFDLKQGRTILIAPQRDGSLRSMQIDSPLMSAEEVEEYTLTLLTRPEIVEFFTNKGNI